jgi:hypothetical protein
VLSPAPPRIRAVSSITFFVRLIRFLVPNAKTQRRRATEQQMQTERATRRPLK